MLGLMSERPLLIRRSSPTAATYHGDTEIVSRTVEGPIHRYTYGEAERRRSGWRALCGTRHRARRPGRHPRLEHLSPFRAVLRRSRASVLSATRSTRGCSTTRSCTSSTMRPTASCSSTRASFHSIERLAPQFPADCRIVLLREGAPETSLPVLGVYDDLLAGEERRFAWPEFDERTAASLCYTSGTTGNPKGALYSHRSTVLHAFGASLPDAIPISARDVVCPVVPLFHACGWGVAYTAPMNGAKLVFPGPRLDGASLYELFEAEGVTVSLGVPTVWLGFEAIFRAARAARPCAGFCPADRRCRRH